MAWGPIVRARKHRKDERDKPINRKRSKEKSPGYNKLEGEMGEKKGEETEKMEQV